MYAQVTDTICGTIRYCCAVRSGKWNARAGANQNSTQVVLEMRNKLFCHERSLSPGLIRYISCTYTCSVVDFPILEITHVPVECKEKHSSSTIVFVFVFELSCISTPAHVTKTLYNKHQNTRQRWASLTAHRQHVGSRLHSEMRGQYLAPPNSHYVSNLQRHEIQRLNSR